jgi:hypothetical protein
MDGMVYWVGLFFVLGCLSLVLAIVGLTAVCGVCSVDMDSGLLLLC